MTGIVLTCIICLGMAAALFCALFTVRPSEWWQLYLLCFMAVMVLIACCFDLPHKIQRAPCLAYVPLLWGISCLLYKLAPIPEEYSPDLGETPMGCMMNLGMLLGTLDFVTILWRY